MLHEMVLIVFSFM